MMVTKLTAMDAAQFVLLKELQDHTVVMVVVTMGNLVHRALLTAEPVLVEVAEEVVLDLQPQLKMKQKWNVKKIGLVLAGAIVLMISQLGNVWK